MMPEQFEAWITRYALTTGTYKATVEQENVSDDSVQELGTRFTTFRHGNDWHRTREEAIARAEEMRGRAIESARKRIAKLEAMNFDEKVPL